MFALCAPFECMYFIIVIINVLLSFSPFFKISHSNLSVVRSPICIEYIFIFNLDSNMFEQWTVWTVWTVYFRVYIFAFRIHKHIVLNFIISSQFHRGRRNDNVITQWRRCSIHHFRLFIWLVRHFAKMWCFSEWKSSPFMLSLPIPVRWFLINKNFSFPFHENGSTNKQISLNGWRLHSMTKNTSYIYNSIHINRKRTVEKRVQTPHHWPTNFFVLVFSLVFRGCSNSAKE